MKAPEAESSQTFILLSKLRTPLGCEWATKVESFFIAGATCGVCVSHATLQNCTRLKFRNTHAGVSGELCHQQWKLVQRYLAAIEAMGPVEVLLGFLDIDVVIR